jgi:Flp pilus assembly protein TadD
MLGSIYLNEKKLDQALAEFEALSKRQTKPVGPLTMAGMILEQQNRRDEARKRYEEVLALDPHAATAANNLAWILAETGEELDRALQLAQTAVASSPDKPEIIDTLGWVYLKNNQPELAIPHFQRCTEKVPPIADCQYHLGLALMRTGETMKAKAPLRRALELQPSPVVAAEVRKLLSAN